MGTRIKTSQGEQLSLLKRQFFKSTNVMGRISLHMLPILSECCHP
jgi:hypothetical protein